jgi:hypothetical protein
VVVQVRVHSRLQPLHFPTQLMGGGHAPLPPRHAWMCWWECGHALPSVLAFWVTKYVRPAQSASQVTGSQCPTQGTGGTHSPSPTLHTSAGGHCAPLPLRAVVVAQVRVHALLQLLHDPAQLIGGGHRPSPPWHACVCWSACRQVPPPCVAFCVTKYIRPPQSASQVAGFQCPVHGIGG